MAEVLPRPVPLIPIVLDRPRTLLFRKRDVRRVELEFLRELGEERTFFQALRQLLGAIAAAGTDEAKAVMAKMRERPVNDFYVRDGRLREDGRLVHDMYFAQVKTPSESTKPWDYYKILGTIPGDQAFRSLADSGCPLVAR